MAKFFFKFAMDKKMYLPCLLPTLRVRPDLPRAPASEEDSPEFRDAHLVDFHNYPRTVVPEGKSFHLAVGHVLAVQCERMEYLQMAEMARSVQCARVWRSVGGQP